MRQRLQRCAEPVLHPPRPVCDPAQLPMFAAEKRHDPVCLPQWIRFQNNRVALKERHATFLVTRELITPDSVRATGNCRRGVPPRVLSLPTGKTRGGTPRLQLKRKTSMHAQPFDVVGLGLNAMDTICVVDSFPQPQSKARIKELHVEPGGQVATALATCSRLGLKARYIGSVGNDDAGRAQLASLRAENVDVEYVRVVDGRSEEHTSELQSP